MKLSCWCLFFLVLVMSCSVSEGRRRRNNRYRGYVPYILSLYADKKNHKTTKSRVTRPPPKEVVIDIQNTRPKDQPSSPVTQPTKKPSLDTWYQTPKPVKRYKVKPGMRPILELTQVTTGRPKLPGVASRPRPTWPPVSSVIELAGADQSDPWNKWKQLTAQDSRCGLEKDRGPCSEFGAKWYYDSGRKGCFQFWYGGCDGNTNRFESEEDCQKHCSGYTGTVGGTGDDLVYSTNWPRLERLEVNGGIPNIEERNLFPEFLTIT